MWFIWFDFSKKKDEGKNNEDYSWIFGYLLMMAFVLIAGGSLLRWIINGWIALF